jgi:hypothetical protein
MSSCGQDFASKSGCIASVDAGRSVNVNAEIGFPAEAVAPQDLAFVARVFYRSQSPVLREEVLQGGRGGGPNCERERNRAGWLRDAVPARIGKEGEKKRDGRRRSDAGKKAHGAT